MDVLLIELGSGGEIVVRNSDLVMVDGNENQPYIAMFGGGGWWGNDLLVNGNARFLSRTEQVLKNTPLTSAGLIAIENAIGDDLQYLTDIPGTKVTVNVTIPSKNRLDVNIDINGQLFYVTWNPDSSFLTYKFIE